MLKKIFFFISISLLSVFFVPQATFAQQGAFIDDLKTQTQAAAGTDGAGLGKPVDPRLVVANVIKLFITTIGVLFFAYMIYGGATIFLSGGSEDKVTEGKDIIKRSVIGLIIVLTSFSITILVTRLVQGQNNPADEAFIIQETPRDKSRATPGRDYLCDYDINGDCIIVP